MVAKRKKAGKKTAATKRISKRKGASARKPERRKKVAKKSATRAPARKKAPARTRVAARTAAGKAFARKAVAVFSAEATPTSFAPYVQRRGEEYMNAAQSKHFRNILLEWKRSLMEEVDRTVHHMQDEASNFPDPNDRATQEEEFALELRTRDRERKLIKKIDDALLGLENGEYGFCEVCGVEIGIKRLEARPTATLCIDCKTLDEIKEKQLG